MKNRAQTAKMDSRMSVLKGWIGLLLTQNIKLIRAYQRDATHTSDDPLEDGYQLIKLAEGVGI